MAENSRRSTAPRLLAPLQEAVLAPTLDAEQAAVVNLPQGSGTVAVWGAPGTGKSTVLVEAAVRRVNAGEVDPSGILVLAPTRVAATRLRDSFTARLGRSFGATPARSWAAYAYDLVRRARAESLLDLPEPPRLLSGPEQDQVIRELLLGPDDDVSLAARFAWPQDLHAALGTRGFRQELRELYDRLAEHDAGPEALLELAPLLGRPEWVPAADFFAEYRDVMDLKNPGAFDPSGIITSARQIFAAHPEFLQSERDRLQLILVDDVHESSRNVLELFLDISDGVDAVLTLSPDTTALGFRGARPDLVRDLLDQSGALSLPLKTSHRLCPGVARAYESVVRRVPTTEAVLGRELSGRPAGMDAVEAENESADVLTSAAQTGAEAHIFTSQGAELRFLSGEILTEQLRNGRSLEDLAVIARNGGEVSRINRYLIGQGISTRLAAAETPVRDEPAVTPLLTVLGIVLGKVDLDPPRAVELLMSRYGGASSTELRRLRQVLRRDERAAEGTRDSDALLLAALADPAWMAELGVAAVPALRLARMLEAGRTAAALPTASGETVLWALWSASRLADQWSETALVTGAAGARADRDLDAVMALFSSAERYATQFPGSSAEGFYDYLTGQEIAMDTLAARAIVDEAVSILTPAGAAGRQWPVVFVVGVQEGVWPNTRLRGELLGSTLLADALEHGPLPALQRGPREKLADIRADELRTFALAVSRAAQRLVVTAAEDEDNKASIFVDYAVPGASLEPRSQAHRPLDVRSLVARLRSSSEQKHTVAQAADQPSAEHDAEAVLGYLARENVPGAAPGQWWGLLPVSTEADLVADGGQVVVSPSKVEKVSDSPLSWFVPAAGGAATTDLARSLGTLIHTIASERPEGTVDEYLEDLKKQWPSLGVEPGWEADRLWERATDMLRRLAFYVQEMRAAGRSLVAVEIDFSVDLPHEVVVRPLGPEPESTPQPSKTVKAMIRGQIDRLETDQQGRAHVVDLKTGTRLPTRDQLLTHAQLGTYQVAVELGAFEEPRKDNPAASGLTISGGAALVALGKSSGSSEMIQEALGDEGGWAMDLVTTTAADMSRSHFEARHSQAGPGQGGCPTPEVCPLCHSGRQVTE